MKRVLLSLLSITALSSAAFAADLPSRKAPAPYIAPIFSWTGFYAGVNAGYAWNADSSLKNVDVNSTVIPGFSRSGQGFDLLNHSDDGSFTGGAQIGYNYQIGSVVLGIEADINYADLKKKYATQSDRFGFYTDRLTAESKVSWFGTVRPRLGFLPMDRLMVFVTGGLAYGQVKTKAGINDYEYDGTWFAGINGDKDDTRVGWTLGAGAEYAITDHLTIKGEYAYVDLGDKTHRFADTGNSYPRSGLYVTAKDQASFHVVRAGVNYKF